MGVFDKLKNALFEVEYVEVEEKPKKEKPIKTKEKAKDEVEDKPIAKKIVLPGKREEKVEEIEEEEMMDDNFEMRPINAVDRESTPAFKFMDDADFEVDDDMVSTPSRSNDITSDSFSASDNDYDYNRATNNDMDDTSMRRSTRNEVRQDPVDENQYNRPIHASNYNSYDEDDMITNSYSSGTSGTSLGSNLNSSSSYDYDSYDNSPYDRPERPIHAASSAPKENKPYGGESTTFKAAKEYGSYEKKEEKTYFKPSPIISPIYGILDKNYKKEDVITKKDIRITTNYSRTNVNVDDIRNKAYGRRSTPEVASIPIPEVEEEVAPSFEVEEDENENLLVDLSDDREKPEVKSITVGDAMEYFDDLGLEYNVDYVDATNKNRRRYNELEEDIKYNMDAGRVEKPIPAPAPAPQVTRSDEDEVKESGPIIDIKNESKNSSTLDDDDNLFDLIDSMYRDED